MSRPIDNGPGATDDKVLDDLYDADLGGGASLRGLLREMHADDLEAPAAGLEALLAASRAQAAAAIEPTFGAKVLRWWRAYMMTPPVLALAGLILVVAALGTVYLQKGNFSENSPALTASPVSTANPPAAAPPAEPAASAPSDATKDEITGGVGDASEAAPKAASPSTIAAPRPVADKRVVSEKSGAERGKFAVAPPAKAKPSKREMADQPVAATTTGASTSKKIQSVDAEVPAMPAQEAADDGFGATLADEAIPQSRAKVMRKADVVAAPSAPAPRAEAQRALPAANSKGGASPAAAGSPRDADRAARANVAMDEPLGTNASPQGSTEGKASQAKPTPDGAKLSGMHAQARVLAGKGDCKGALEVIRKIQAASAAYYKANVANDRALAACR